MSKLEVLISPISGGYFVSQTAIVALLLEARDGENFDVLMGASGGNLVNILSLHFTKNKESLERLLDKIHSELFVRNWFEGKFKNYLPSYLAGIFRDGLYKDGYGAEELFQKLYSKKFFDIKPEIWSLSFNEGMDMGCLNSSKNKETSILSDYISDEYLYSSGVGEVKYLDGDVINISKTTQASANIPGFKKSVDIGQYSYVDGGLCRASPASLLSEALNEKINDEGISIIRYHYIQGPMLTDNGNGLMAKDGLTNSNWISNIIENFKNLITSTVYSDRQMCFENWMRSADKRYSQLVKEKLSHITFQQLKEKITELDGISYFMVFYISADIYVNLIDFNGEDAIKRFREAYKMINVDIYY